MRRRQFITLVGGVAATWPLAARAQQPKIPVMPVVGFLSSRGLDGSAHELAAFQLGLKEAGYIEGQNVVVEYRWADGHYDRLQSLAVDLVYRQVAVIAAFAPPAAAAAKAATTTIPIVFSVGSDPVRVGLVTNLARPSGNLTGTARLVEEVLAKRLQLLHELAPSVTSVGVLTNPDSPRTGFQTKEIQETATSLGLTVYISNAGSERDFANAFASLVREGAGAVIVLPDPFFNSRSRLLVDLANKHALPAIYPLREYVVAGGLMAYGASLSESYQRAGTYVGRILKGAKPADLPVFQSTKVELIINLKTAKTLGLTVPLPLLGRADEVIE